MICFRDEKTMIEYLASEQAICCSWKGEVSSGQFQMVMQLKLQYMGSLHTRNWMLDIRYMQAISFDDQQWVIENWMPEFLKLPIRKVAIIQSLNVYNNMVIEDIIRYTPPKAACEVQLFADYEDSLDWIRDLSQSSFWKRAGIAW